LLLMRAKYETYLPRIRVRNRIMPLFAGYLFVDLTHRHFYPIMWIPHVVRLLMCGDRPAQLHDNIVNEIRKREHNGLVKLPIRRIRKGDSVRIMRGNFEGRFGLYEGMAGRDRERVLLELLGQVVPVELPAKDIAPVIVARETRLRY